MKSRFSAGLAIGLVLFILVNLVSAHLSSDCGLPALVGRDSCADDIVQAGWPMPFYEEGGLNYRRTFDRTALAIDVVLAGIIAAATGWLFTRMKPTRRK